jgi:hypothetical protein
MCKQEIAPCGGRIGIHHSINKFMKFAWRQILVEFNEACSSFYKQSHARKLTQAEYDRKTRKSNKLRRKSLAIKI